MATFDEATNKWLAWISDRDASILTMPEDVQEALRSWAGEASADAVKAVAWDLMRAVLDDCDSADWFPAWSSAEVGGEDQPANGVVILDWNQIPVIEQGVFEALGMETSWSDAIDRCSVCDLGVLTQPQFYGWRRKFYARTDGEVVCFACLDAEESEREALIEDLLSRPAASRAIPHARFLPASYIRVDFQGANGFYGGQSDDPTQIGKFLAAQGVTRYLFNITDIGQFDVHFDVWVDSEQDGILYGVAMSSSWRRPGFLADASGEPAMFPSPTDARAAADYPGPDLRWPEGLRGQVEVLALFPGLQDAARGLDPAVQMKKALAHAAQSSRGPAPTGAVRYTQLHMNGTSTTRDIPADAFITKGVS